MLRGSSELADALPYLLGYYPDDSVVLVALHGPQGRFGGRVRIGIPRDREQWDQVADQLAACLVGAAEERGGRPEGVIAYLCQDPVGPETGGDVKRRLQPFAQRLRTAFGALDVPVLEALCLSSGRYWSYCCPDYRCCPDEGTRLALPGTSVMAATAAYTGMRVRGSLRDMEARFAPFTGRRAVEQEKALDAVASALVPRLLDAGETDQVARETSQLLHHVLDRFRSDVPSGSTRARDACDDALLTPGESAELIIGLQDREVRDEAARWMEDDAAAPALRLWRALSRRCVGGFREHAAAPLALAGWVAWSSGDEPSARVALGAAVQADPEYVFARLLQQAINQGLDAEEVRRCLRGAGEPRGPKTSSGNGSSDLLPGTGGRGDAGAVRAGRRPVGRTSAKRRGAKAGRGAETKGPAGPAGVRPAGPSAVRPRSGGRVPAPRVSPEGPGVRGDRP
ncbi:DUF4192 domain-containing protein [Streptomyces sp. NPDC059740]|uniref:DUF4192 domain-containing protein n=1 Tax=Streptomyces sp. NPDC059740 TaxID=3346926 RepID=UPI00366383EB